MYLSIYTFTYICIPAGVVHRGQQREPVLYPSLVDMYMKVYIYMYVCMYVFTYLLFMYACVVASPARVVDKGTAVVARTLALSGNPPLRGHT